MIHRPATARLPRLIAGAACLLVLACAPDLREDYPFSGPLPDGQYVTTALAGDGTATTQVDASGKTQWIYLDLETRPDLAVTQAAGNSDDWDLAFQRFKIITNGGANGGANAEVAVLPGADFDGLQQAPTNGYVQDTSQGSAFTAGDGWYVYDIGQHKLLPRDIVYVVHTESAYFKLKLLDYYDSVGTSGKPSFRWAPLQPPGQKP